MDLIESNSEVACQHTYDITLKKGIALGILNLQKVMYALTIDL